MALSIGIVIAAALLVLVFSFFEKTGYTTLTLVVTAAALDLVFKVPIAVTIASNPLLVLGWLGVYIVAGVVWALPKWMSYVHSVKRRYVAARESWSASDAVGQIANSNELWLKSNAYKFHWEDRVPPKAKDNKARIFGWAANWPTSVLWTVLDEPVRRLFEWVLSRIRHWYDGIASNAFKDEGL